MEEVENEGQRSVGLGEDYSQSLSWPVGQLLQCLADVRNTGEKAGVAQLSEAGSHISFLSLTSSLASVSVSLLPKAIHLSSFPAKVVAECTDS